MTPPHSFYTDTCLDLKALLCISLFVNTFGEWIYVLQPLTDESSMAYTYIALTFLEGLKPFADTVLFLHSFTH